MSTSFSRTGTFAKLLAVLCVALVPDPAYGQAASLAHFVAPAYPALARQAMISGQVVLRLGVDTDGKILEVREEASSHPLLTQEAKKTVRQWEFQSWPRPHSVSVTVYFGFSGTTCESNPVTVVKADFAASTNRVYVTTDGVPAVRPQGRTGSSNGMAAQGPTQPVQGRAYERALDALFPGGQPMTGDSRFRIVLRFLPPFSEESEIVLTYKVDRTGTAVLSTPSQAVSQNFHADIERLRSVITVDSRAHDVDRRIAAAWVEGFWKAISGLAREVPAKAFEGDAGGEVEVVLDASTYVVTYTDAHTELKLARPGPDPDAAIGRRQLDPIVKWMLNVRRQIASLAEPVGSRLNIPGAGRRAGKDDPLRIGTAIAVRHRNTRSASHP